MADVSLDELLGFISMKVFCPGNPKRNLALRSLAGTMVYEKNEYTHPVCRKAKKYTKPFGPASAACHRLWILLRDRVERSLLPWTRPELLITLHALLCGNIQSYKAGLVRGHIRQLTGQCI